MFTGLRRFFEELTALRSETAAARAETAAALAQIQAERERDASRQAESAQDNAARLEGLAAEIAGLRAGLTALDPHAGLAAVDAALAQLRVGLTAAEARAGEGATELSAIHARMDQLARLIVAPPQLFPSDLWTPEAACQVRKVLALLTPHGVAGLAKSRIGREFDGGYVMLEDFAGIGAALSLGINDDVSWDSEIVAHGIDVWQFDPTVSGPPVEHERFHFAPLRVAGTDGAEQVSLAGILRDYVRDEAAPLLLKMDIEGDEWEVLEASPPELLGRFRQIVCEFHHLERLGEAAFAERAQAVFARLAETHFVVHVHGNNCGSLVNVGNVVVPETLEISFAHRGAYEPVETAELFPTALDQPNEPGRADLYLGSFRF